MDLKSAYIKVKERKHLTKDEAYEVFKKIATEDWNEEDLERFLRALREKGESWQEIVGAVLAYREVMIPLPHSLPDSAIIVDTCGTGGDQKHTFNFSTAVAIALASEENIYVAKHGNRAISSKCGSADLIESLGISLDLAPEVSAKALREVGFVFLFAPLYHPAFKKVASVRKKIGRTIFNILGPLLNPAKPNYQLLGVYDFLLTEKIAYVLDDLALKRALVVFGEEGYDEITVTGSTKISELREGKITTYYIDPEDFGFELCEEPEKLQGGTSEENVKTLEALLRGEVEGFMMDMLLMNLGGALYLCEKTIDFKGGIKKAKELISSGKVWQKYLEIKNYYQSLTH